MKTTRTLTPEQETQRDARRSHFSALVKHLKEMNDADRNKFSEMAITNPKGHRLSPINTILINLQRPGCKIVAGYKQWKKYNHHVTKGERGVTIWVPSNAPKNEDEPIPENIKFSTSTVYDVSQTTEEIQEAVPVKKYDESKAYSPVRNMDAVTLIQPGERR